MQYEKIESSDIIWKFHVNPSNHQIYIECKNENNEFYLWDYISNQKWTFPSMDKHTTNLIQLQYPYVILNYLNTENLIHSSTLACYDLENDKLHWASSEIKLEQCFDGVLQVYNAKITPRKTEYITFDKEAVNPETLKELNLDFQFADYIEGKFQLEYKGKNYCVFFDESNNCMKLSVEEHNQVIWETSEDASDYRQEYDYLMRISNKIVFMLDKHRIIILQ